MSKRTSNNGDHDSRRKLVEAAIAVFAEKGKHGARMEEIAARAGVNKAMAYYYFAGKDNLYKTAVYEILKNISLQISARLKESAAESLSPIERMKQVVAAHVESFSRHGGYSKIVMEALLEDPDYVHTAIVRVRHECRQSIADRFLEILRDGRKKLEFRDIDPKQTLVSFMGMNLIYFIGHPIARAMLDLSKREEREFLKRRPDCVIDLLLNGMAAKGVRRSRKKTE